MPKKFFYQIFLIMGCILISMVMIRNNCFSQAEAPLPKKQVIYLELREENFDTFNSVLFRIKRKPQLHPFFFRHNNLMIDDEGLKTTHEEAKAQGYFSKNQVNVKEGEGITVYLRHIIRFNGIGRKYHWSEYYVFNQFPQIISFPFSKKTTSTFYTLKEGMTKVLEIRLAKGDIKIKGASEKGEVTIEYAGETLTIASGQRQSLGERSETINIIKGSPLATMIDYGQKKFTSKLVLKNYGFPAKVEWKGSEKGDK